MKPYPWVTRRQQMVSLSLGPADSYGLFSPISNSAQACLDPNMKQGVAGRCVLGSGRDSHYLPLLPVTPSGQGLVRKTPHLMSLKTQGIQSMWALTTLSKGHSFHHRFLAPSLVDFRVFSPFPLFKTWAAKALFYIRVPSYRCIQNVNLGRVRSCQYLLWPCLSSPLLSFLLSL